MRNKHINQKAAHKPGRFHRIRHGVERGNPPTAVFTNAAQLVQGKIAQTGARPDGALAENRQRSHQHSKDNPPLFAGHIVQLLHNLNGAAIITENLRFFDKLAQHNLKSADRGFFFVFLCNCKITLHQAVGKHRQTKLLSPPGFGNIFPTAHRQIIVQRQFPALQSFQRRRRQFRIHCPVIALQKFSVFFGYPAFFKQTAEKIVIGHGLFDFGNIKQQQSFQSSLTDFFPKIMLFGREKAGNQHFDISQTPLAANRQILRRHRIPTRPEFTLFRHIGQTPVKIKNLTQPRPVTA